MPDQSAGCAARVICGFTLAVLLALALGLAAGSDPGDDLPPALAERHQRAAGGNAAAQLDLGRHYVTGRGIPPDESAALRWIGTAAAHGHPAAQFELGSDYTLESHRDFGRAAALLRQSALPGFAPAQSRLAVRYLAGAGVPVDRVEAYAWLGLAAAQGEHAARDLAPGVQSDLSDVERELARQRAQ